jgi:hypothetical protein
VQARFDCSKPPTQAGRYFGQRQIGPVVQDDYGSFVGVQAADRSQQRIGGQDCFEWIRPWLVVIFDPDEADPASASDPVTANIDQDSIEPGREGRSFAQRSGRLPGPNAGILDDILRIRPAAEKQTSQSIGSIQACVDQIR